MYVVPLPSAYVHVAPDSVIVNRDGTRLRLDAFNLDIERTRPEARDVRIKPCSLLTFFSACDRW